MVASNIARALSANNIPVSERLMAVADVYDALTTKRIYKNAFSHEVAVSTMVAERGLHFDPDMIDAMLSIQDDFLGIARSYQDSSEWPLKRPSTLSMLLSMPAPEVSNC